jgi:hypothetical protein
VASTCSRRAEALPCLLLSYPDIDWTWVINQVKPADAQNRLGFLVAVGFKIPQTVE